MVVLMNFYGTERMGRWLCPASKAETAFFTSAIVLNDKGIVLGQFGTLNIYTRPATRLTIGRFELSRRWANDGDTALCHGCTIGCDVVRGEDEVEVAIAFGQAIQYALLSFLWCAHSDQFEVGIADDDNAIGGSAGGVDTSAGNRQAQLLTEDSLCLRQIMNTDNNVIQSIRAWWLSFCTD